MVMQPLFGYESFYKINTNGEVFSIRRNHMLKYRISNGGYKRVKLYNETGHKEITVHRLVGMQYIVNKNNKPDINHIDGDKFNNCVSNLEWVTKAENTRHAVSLGLSGCWNSKKNGKLSGEGNGRCKLSDKTIKSIRRMYTRKYGEIAELAKRFNVTTATISRIVNNKYRMQEVQIGY